MLQEAGGAVSCSTVLHNTAADWECSICWSIALRSGSDLSDTRADFAVYFPLTAIGGARVSARTRPGLEWSNRSA